LFSNIKTASLLILAFSLCSCSEDGAFPLIGYIEGEYIYTSSVAGGQLIQLNVSRGQMVKSNELLFELDPSPDEDARDFANAFVSEAKAQLAYSTLQYERQKKLYLQRTIDRSAVDQAEADFKSKQDEVIAAQEKLAQAEWLLAQKKIVSPTSGQVVDIFYRVGEYVQANKPVLSLLAPENIKVLFYIPETLLSRVQIGQEIGVNCDGCIEAISSKISYISPEAEFTPPVIYSKDTRYKLVYLIRADLPIDIATQFHPGQPVDILLHE
jgi:HlyD family secretion protein